MLVRKMMFAGALAFAGTVAPRFAMSQDYRASTTSVAFSTEELDNLLAPIALYPDAILAQVLVAATFPDQLDVAARFVRSRGTRDIDDQPWDVSVKSVAHYPPVLNMLADRPDWTTALGQAYAMQSSDVMESVQHLREMANAQGNLRSTSQQNVVVDGRYIRIEPAQPRVIFVPTYDPEVIYYRPVVQVGIYTGHWSFGVGFPIGAWLSYDCDWYSRRVYYTGWNVNYGWRVVAYPYIRVTPVYINPRYDVVYVNRTVVHRYVDYDRLRVYNTVHRTVTYDDHRRGGAPGPIQRDGYRNDSRGNDSRNDGRYDGRNDNRNDGRNDGRSDGRTDNRNDSRTDNRVGPRTDNRNDGRTDSRNDGRTDNRTDNRNDGRTTGRNDPPARNDDRGRQATPPAGTDRRAQGRDENSGADRRGGVFAPRQQPQREPARTNEPTRTPPPQRTATPERRNDSPPPRGNTQSRGSSSQGSQSSGHRENGGDSRGSAARGKRG